MSDKSVSVVIVSYQAGTMLTDCVRSVLASRVPVKVYISDNGSQDDSISHLRSTLGEHPLVSVIRNDANLGFAKGNNIALPHCQFDYVLCLNPDAILAEDCLEKLVQAAEQQSGFASFASRMIQTRRRDLLDGAGDTYHVSGLVWRRGHGASVNGNDYKDPTEVFSACAAVALYRREAIQAVGGFDEDFFCYLEDVDLGFRLRLAGHRCLYVPDAVAYHIGSATTGRNSDFAVYHGHRNLVWTYVKNMPGPLFWLYLPLHIAVNLGSIVWYAFKGRWRVMLQAKWDAVKGLPAMWRKRREIQAHRAVSASVIRQAMEKGLPRKRR